MRGGASGRYVKSKQMILGTVSLGATKTRLTNVKKRAAMLASRSKDPGVIVDVPQDPTAEEVEAAKSADGTVTPGVNTPGMVAKTFGSR